MNRISKLFLMSLMVLCMCATACTPKAKKDADKLTEDIVDYTQDRVDEAVDAVKENSGDISEKVVDGLRDVAENLKDEAESLFGEIKDDIEKNAGNVYDEVKDSLGKTSDDIKESIPDDLDDKLSAIKDSALDKFGEVLDKVKDGIENTDIEVNIVLKFRNKTLLEQHFEKHGKEMGFTSMESYEKAASDVVNNPEALHKTEAEDGDLIYYLEATNEFVVVSTDGYIRTYFLPSGGKKYYDRQ